MKIAVIGTGFMGRNHIRVLKNISEVDKIVISDINKQSLYQTAKEYAIQKKYLDYKELILKEKPDGIIIATSTKMHKEVTLFAISNGLNILVEKPIAPNIKDARLMIDAAKKKDIVFTVGHIERYNPVIKKIKNLLDEKFLNNIYLINTHRIGPFPKRLLGKDESVLIDLAVHDLDIINYLGGKIKTIKSNTIKVQKQKIYAMILMSLENKIKASCEFSWISPRYSRTIEIYGDSGMIMGDYFNQEVWFYENSDFDYHTSITESFLGAGLITPGKVIKYPMYKQEPLFLELQNFIRAIRNLEPILVQPEQALLALKIAASIV